MPERLEIHDLNLTLQNLPESDPVVLAHFLRYLMIGPGRGKALDAGCGTGYGSELLRRLGFAPVHAFDKEIADWIPAAYPLITFTTNTFEDIEIDPVAWDLVTCFEALEHLDDPPAALKNLFAGVKPGGRLIASVPINHPDRIWHRHVYTPESADALFATLGGRLMQHSIPTGHRVWVITK